MKKRFEGSDAIEIGLYNYVSCYYHLKYRFLPKKVRIHILWFFITITVKDSWHILKLYDSSGIAEEINPDDKSLWQPVQINITDTSDIQYYKSLKHEILTYEDLDKTYNITLRKKQYEIDKLEYNLANSK